MTGGDSPRRARWPYIALIPFGFGAWAPIYAGVKARRPLWIALGVLWSAMVVVALALSSGKGHSNDGPVGALVLIAWFGSIATSFSSRGEYGARDGLAAARGHGSR